MKIFYSTAAFFITAILCCLFTNGALVTVKYPREPVMEKEGRSLSLKCVVNYRTEDCNIDAKWGLIASGTENVPISDANRFIIIVNETQEKEQQERHRNIFLTFKSLGIEDTGLYQCDAKCLNSGTAAKGHVLNLNVTADPLKGLKVSTWSGQLKADAVALTFSIMLFFGIIN